MTETSLIFSNVFKRKQKVRIDLSTLVLRYFSAKHKTYTKFSEIKLKLKRKKIDSSLRLDCARKIVYTGRW